MGITAAILSGVAAAGSTAYTVSQQRQAAKRGAAAESDVLDTRPDASAQLQQANTVAAGAVTQQRKKTASAQGYSSTLLNGGAGITDTAPPQRKTLLGT